MVSFDIHSDGNESPESKQNSSLVKCERLQHRAINEPCSTPFLPFASCWRLDLHGSPLDFIPIGAQSRASTLGETLQHRLFRIFVGICVNLLEEGVERGITAYVRVLLGGLLLFGGEDIVRYALPILVFGSSRLSWSVEGWS